MSERLRTNNITEPIPEPDMFAPDFGKKLEKMIVWDTAQEAAKSALQVAAIAPLTILTRNHAADPIHFTLTKPFIAGVTVGVGCAIEEAFEVEEDRNFGRKVISMTSKFGAGFLAAYSITTNAENGNSWISSENLPQTIALVPAAYVLARETSINQLLAGIKSVASNKSEARKENLTRQRVNQLVKQSHNLNVKKSGSAKYQLYSAFGPEMASKLISGQIKAEQLSFRSQQPENGDEEGNGNRRHK